MNSVAPRPLLARLRTSARLAVLVLLVFAIKIGAATACAKHDFADMGLGSDSDHAAFVKVALADDGADPADPLLGHVGCCQCSCQEQSKRQDQPTTLSHFPYLALYSLGVISICFLKILLK